MNFIYNRRLDFNFKLQKNIDNLKLINSIKLLILNNNFIYLVKNKKKFSNDALNKNIYILIIKKKFIVNFSHLFYDAYSINLIIQKIDEIYKDEIKDFKFNFYSLNTNFINYYYNNIKMIANVNCKNLIKVVTKKKKLTFKILKDKMNNLSSSEIINYIINKFKIENYCLVVNARKIFKEYENILGNLIYISNKINKDEDIRSILEKDVDRKLTSLLNTIPNTLLINSYLSFNLPSFIKMFKMEITSFGNVIFIYPLNLDNKYIIIDYYH
jgi:hypothetical protein